MVEALEAGYDLAALALCFLALGLLLATKGIVGALLRAIDFSVLGVRPLHGLVAAAESAVIGALDDAIKGVERATTRFESGLIDSFGLLIALPVLGLLGVKAALSYLWNHALRPTIHSIADPIRTVANKAAAQVDALEGEIAANVGAAERYAREHATSAAQAAEAVAAARLEAVAGELRRDIAGALHSAEGYADQAVGRLRAAEDAAVATAVGLAAEAKLAGELAGRAALAAAELEFGPEIAAARAAAAAGLAELDHAGKAALGALEGVVITVGDDLRTIEGDLGALGTAGLLAAVPALATVVHAIATEAGLENAECRSKVKGICETNPSAWGSLLATLTALGFVMSLPELARVANGLADDLVPIIRRAA